MCQLIFSNLYGIPKTNRIVVYYALLRCSKFNNRDGWGIFSSNGRKDAYVKSGKEPALDLDLVDKIKKYSYSDLPMLAHVRQASLTNQVKTISDDKAHPFLYENIALAHNGSLELESEEEKFPEGKIDSEYFAEILNEERKEKDFLTALRDTYARFRGKFAFMIFDKKDNTYYIARGKADLHKINVARNGEPVGYFIITEKFSAEEVFNLVKLHISWDIKTPISATIEPLKEGTVYRAGDILEEIGEMKEKERKVVFSQPVVTRPVISSPYTPSNKKVHRVPFSAHYYQQFVKRITDISQKLGLTLYDLELICSATLKKSITELLPQDLNKLDATILLLDKADNSKLHKKKAKSCRRICKLSYSSQWEISQLHGLKFPLIKNDYSILNDFEVKLRKKYNVKEGDLDWDDPYIDEEEEEEIKKPAQAYLLPKPEEEKIYRFGEGRLIDNYD